MRSNMKLEEQVVSFEFAIQLKTLDVKQDSYWKWENYSKNTYGYVKEWQLTGSSCLDDEVNVIGLRDPKDYEIYSAFTVAELGVMLPPYAESYRIATNQFSCKFCELIEDKKGNPKNDKAIINIAKTEADARAKMLIYLLSED